MASNLDHRYNSNGTPKSFFFKRNSKIAKLVKQYGLKCHWCGVECDPKADSGTDLYPTVEHLRPRSCGGTWRFANLRVACRKCNSTRGAPQTVDAFALESVEILLGQYIADNGPIGVPQIKDLADEIIDRLMNLGVFRGES